MIREFNRIYYHGPAGHPKTFTTHQYRGVPVLKTPTDLFVYQELISFYRPEIIIECGVAYGGTTYCLADLCLLGDRGVVYGVDIDLAHVNPRVVAHPRVRLLPGSSTDPLIVKFLTAQAQGKETLVILDSDHSEHHVMRELECYSPLIGIGRHLIVEDTNLPLVEPDAPPGPSHAVDHFLARHPEWQRDLHSERDLLTFNPGGYLVRTAPSPEPRR